MFSKHCLRIATLAVAVSCLLPGGAHAMGGAGTSGEKDSGPHMRKLKLVPSEEGLETPPYGWARISQDQLQLGFSRAKGNNWYSLYFVNGEEKRPVTPKTFLMHSNGEGQAAISVRLTEPLGAHWAKLVVFMHGDNKQKSEADLKPVLEASLR